MSTESSTIQATETVLVQRNQNFIPLLDFVRSIAVSLVILNHLLLIFNVPDLFGATPGFIGLVGVWMFFVHTSLVLMWSLERKPYTLDFYIRRIFRIYPLALMAIAVALATRAPLIAQPGSFFSYRPTSPGNIVAVCLLLYNLAPSHLNYNSIVSVIWSLPIEVEMYLVLPVLFSFARRDRTIWPLFLIWCMAMAVFMLFSQNTSTLLSAIPVFLPGIIAFVAYKRFRARLPAWLFPAFLFLLVGCIAHTNLITLGGPFALILGFGLPLFKQFSASFFTRACNKVAKYSYGIYLGHPFAFLLGFRLLHGHNVGLQFVVAFLATAAISIGSYHILEKPMIELGSRVAAAAEVRSFVRHGNSRNAL